MTRGSVFLAAVMAVASLGAMAQNDQVSPPQKGTDKNPQPTVIITGCLSSSGNGVYAISDAEGTTYTLAGNTGTLQGHAEQKVQITGQQAFGSATSSTTSSPAKGSASLPINVTTTKFVADHCTGTGSTQPARTAGSNGTDARLIEVAQSEESAAANNGQLPQTSTILPLLGLIGLGSLVAGFFARR
jgi:hypothetical protein